MYGTGLLVANLKQNPVKGELFPPLPLPNWVMNYLVRPAELSQWETPP